MNENAQQYLTATDRRKMTGQFSECRWALSACTEGKRNAAQERSLRSVRSGKLTVIERGIGAFFLQQFLVAAFWLLE